MDNSSALAPDQDQKKYGQQDKMSEWGERGFKQGEGQGSSGGNYEPREQGSSNEGYQEDEPGKPVHTTGSTRKDQESGSIQPGDDREGKH